jgi:hypothetical protein
VDDANDTSAHDVQDEGEGYDEVLNRLSAEDEMRNVGEVRLIISKLLQTTSTGVYKYSKIFEKRKYEKM